MLRKLINSDKELVIGVDLTSIEVDGEILNFNGNYETQYAMISPSESKAAAISLSLDNNELPVLFTEAGFEKVPLFIALGHELIHALHGFEGERIPRIMTGSYSYVDPYGNTTIAVEPLEELRTSGIPHEVRNAYTDEWTAADMSKILVSENTLRGEHYLPMRVAFNYYE